MNKKKLQELIKKLVNEYTGTGASGGNAGDGNNITSPRPFADDLEELENYLHKNIYGGEGGHYRKDADPFNYNRKKMTMFEELKKLIQKELNEQAYGSATLTTQGQYKSRFTKTGRPPGIMEKEKLNEFTDYGQEGIYPKKEKPGDMFQQKEVEDLFPHGMASRNDKAFQARVKQHADWTEQSAYNNTFVHMQYHETKGLEDEYFIYQTQHYNSNYDDFRNPKFTILSITKNKDTEKEEDLGEYIVDTDAYIRDLNKFREQGTLGDRVMESKNLKEHNQRAKDLADDYSVEELQDRLDQIYRDMEQEAEPEGGPIADMYADEIDAYEKAIQMKKGKSKKDVPYDVAIGKMTQDEYDEYMSTIAKDKDTFTKSSKFDRLEEQGGDAEAKAYEAGLKRLQKGVIAYQLRYIEKQKAKAAAQAASGAAEANKGFDEQIKALKDQIKAIDNPPKQQKESLYRDYVRLRTHSNLMEYMDAHKREILLEGTVKKFFKMFEAGKTNEDIIKDYAKKGITVPEQFINKVKKQYENYKKQKLEIEFSEQEAKNIITLPKIPDAQLFTTTDDQKKLSTGIYQEKIN